MPKVDLGSTTNLLAQPVQAPKGRARDLNPFATVLSSLDSRGKRGLASAEPIDGPVETVTREQPPASPAGGACGDERRAVDADLAENPAQEQPTEAQDCASCDDVPSSASSPVEPDADVKVPQPESKGDNSSDQAEMTASVDMASQPPSALRIDETTGCGPALNAVAATPPEHTKPAQSTFAETPRDAKAAPAAHSDGAPANSSASRGEKGPGQGASPAIGKGPQLASPISGDDSEVRNAGVVVGTVAPNNVKGLTPRSTESTTSPAPHLTLDTSIQALDEGMAERATESDQRRPAARTRPATSPAIKPIVIPSEMKAVDEAKPAASGTSNQLTVEQTRPDDQRHLNDDRQDPNQKLPPGQPHQASVMPHPTSAPSAPAGQAATNSTQASPASGNSQKAGVSNAISTSAAAPLSGAQVKQLALDRLTAQAPLLKQGIEQASFIPQAAKGLAMALKQSDGTITLKLTPGHLGALKIEITLQGTEVAARIEPSTDSARQLLIDSQSSLRAALEARGLSVERIEVTAPQGAPAQDARDQRNPGQQQDQSGAGFAGQGDAGRHTGRDAEAFAGQQGRAVGHRSDPPAGGEEPWPTTQDSAITLALDNGGTYRLHIDAVA